MFAQSPGTWNKMGIIFSRTLSERLQKKKTPSNKCKVGSLLSAKRRSSTVGDNFHLLLMNFSPWWLDVHPHNHSQCLAGGRALPRNSLLLAASAHPV